MGAEASLAPGHVTVAPGGEAVVEVEVTNTGSVVDSFTLQVLEPAAQWAVCEPQHLSLFPGQTGRARMSIRPPSDVAAGELVYGVRVVSAEDPLGSVVVEAALLVSGVPVVTAEMSPRLARARGMRASKRRIAIDNRGNAAGTVRFAGGDEQDSLDLSFHPAELEVPARSAVFAEVRVRATRRFWRGDAQTHRFHVEAHPTDGPPSRMDGSLVQEAVIPAWLPKAAALAAAGVAAVVLLWFTLFKPVIKDTATDAGAAATKRELNKVLAANADPAQGGGGAGGSGTGSGAGGGNSSTSAPTPTPGAQTSRPSTPKIQLPPPAPFARELTASDDALAANSKQQLTVTDLVLQNPAGDKGTLTVARGGTVLIRTRLENFRDYDLHFVTPITVPAGTSLTMSVTCENAGGKACTPAVLVSGMTITTAL